MELVNVFNVRSSTNNKSEIQLWIGDVTDTSGDTLSDALVVSAYPGSYYPSDSSLIGALHREGVSVAELADAKVVDLRESFSCWLSKPIHSNRKFGFSRILCFEPAESKNSTLYSNPEAVVGDIFRSLAPFLGDSDPIKSISLPVVLSGDQGMPFDLMLKALLNASIHWMSAGLPLETIRIVVYERDRQALADSIFETAKHEAISVDKGTNEFDLFISYAHVDGHLVDPILDAATHCKPDLRVFLDRLTLNVGVSWQQEIFEAIDNCAIFVALLSPNYLASDICKEEFNLAWARSRTEKVELMFPVLVTETPLPTYMSLRQFADCKFKTRSCLERVGTELALKLDRPW